ncbi:hypothetical protein [Moorena producens]|uniref:hypothetical protein n=1 Tax=Moorena producens TaxID=1155739 RepID=UPI003C755867
MVFFYWTIKLRISNPSCLLPFASCLLPFASCLLPLAYCLLPCASMFTTQIQKLYQLKRWQSHKANRGKASR